MRYLIALTFLYLLTACSGNTSEKDTTNPEKVENKKTEINNKLLNDTVIDQVKNNEEAFVSKKEVITSSETKNDIETTFPPKKNEVNITLKSQKIEDNAINDSLKHKTKSTIPHSIHSTYSVLLKKYVSETGIVNYEKLKNEKSLVEVYINELQQTNYKTLDKNNQLAFLINFYNVLTLQLIINNYPIKSIMDIPKAWDTPVIKYQGKKLTLNDIEHQIIRKEFDEPRIHFACNCAAVSCPKLLNEAYEGSKLESQLKKQTLYFLNNQSKNSISKNELRLSKIFEWYSSDFNNNVEYIQKYKPEVSSSAKVTYLEYNWDLNSKLI